MNENFAEFLNSKGLFYKKAETFTDINEIVKAGEEYAQLEAIRFAEWIEIDYALVYSLGLKKSAWVNKNKYDIYINGSDLHFTSLIEQVGKTTKELYQIFLTPPIK